MIYVMVITALTTALFKVPLDYLLNIWICPVSEKQSDFPQNYVDKQGRENEGRSNKQEAHSLTRLHQIVRTKNEESNTYFTFLKRLFQASDKPSRSIPQEIIRNHEITEIQVNLMRVNRNSSKDVDIDYAEKEYVQENDCVTKTVLLCRDVVRSGLILANGVHTLRSQQIRKVSSREEKMLRLYIDQWGIHRWATSLTTLKREFTTAIESGNCESIFDTTAIKAFHLHFHQMKPMIEKAIPFVQQSGAAEAGLELMHFFVIDLLGQTTPSARIFRNKFNEDFVMMVPVTRLFKYISIFLVFALNGFFIYFILLRAVSKGLNWQWQYFNVVLSQFFIEILLFESIECLSLHYLIPETVRLDVKKAIYVLGVLAENVETLVYQHFAMEEHLKGIGENDQFDSSSYLFVSKPLARLRTDLIESYIIIAYHNHFPGMICHSWPHYRQRLHENSLASKDPINLTQIDFEEKKAEENNQSRIDKHKLFSSRNLHKLSSYNQHSTRRESTGTESWLFVAVMSLASGILYSFQFIGLLPMFSQRIIIRLIQTAVLSGLTLTYYTAVHNKPYFFLFSLVIFIVVVIVGIRFLITTKDTNADKVLNKTIDEIHKHPEKITHKTIDNDQIAGPNLNKQDHRNSIVQFDEFLLNAEESELNAELAGNDDHSDSSSEDSIEKSSSSEDEAEGNVLIEEMIEFSLNHKTNVLEGEEDSHFSDDADRESLDMRVDGIHREEVLLKDEKSKKIIMESLLNEFLVKVEEENDHDYEDHGLDDLFERLM